MNNIPTRKPASHLKIVSWTASLIVLGLLLQRVVANELPTFLFSRYQSLLAENTSLGLFMPGILSVSAFILYTFQPDGSVVNMKRSFRSCFTDDAEIIPIICLLLVLLAITFAIFKSLWVEQGIQLLQ